MIFIEFEHFANENLSCPFLRRLLQSRIHVFVRKKIGDSLTAYSKANDLSEERLPKAGGEILYSIIFD